MWSNGIEMCWKVVKQTKKLICALEDISTPRKIPTRMPQGPVRGPRSHSGGTRPAGYATPTRPDPILPVSIVGVPALDSRVAGLRLASGLRWPAPVPRSVTWQRATSVTMETTAGSSM